jgi:cyanophycin synthetase
MNKVFQSEILQPPGITKPQFSLLITGDMSFGENYQVREEERGRENILKNRGYAFTTEKVAPLLKASDLVLCNLETVVTDRSRSPYADTKGYVHWSDIRETPKQLLAHNIKSVSLANNHTIDFGEPGLLQTLRILAGAGIAAFGAGKNLLEARRPFEHSSILVAPEGHAKAIRLRAYAAFAVDDKYRDQFKAYAGSSQPGTNPLLLSELCSEIAATKTSDPHCFVIVVLHWRRDYKWRSERQVEAAQALLKAGADLLIGHGSHMMQEIEKINGRWVAHGLGNFVFNSPGRYKDTKAPPYSLVARLIFTIDCPRPRFLLYPLMTDNRITGYQTRFVSDHEFEDVVRILRARTNNHQDFDAEIGTGEDGFGRFISVPLVPPHSESERTPQEINSAKLPNQPPAAFTATMTQAFNDADANVLKPAVTPALQLGSIVFQETKPRPPLFATATTHVFKGPNIFMPKAAVRLAIDVTKHLWRENPLSADMIGFLLDLLPDLDRPPVAVASADLPQASDWLKSAGFAEATAAATFTLMRRVDEKISGVVTGPLKNESGFYLVCEYKRSAENAMNAALLAVEIIQTAIEQPADGKRVRQKLVEFEKTGSRRGRLSLNTVHILEEAEARGIPVDNSIAGPTRLGHGRFQKRLQQTMTDNTGYLAVKMARDKHQTLAVLRESGIPVPEHRLVETANEAVDAAETIAYPVVVKPANGNMGRGVSVKLMSASDVADAFDEAAKVGKPVIVERYISGSDYRLLVVDGELVAACQRVPGHVIGNGKDSIRRLLKILNADPRRDNRLMHKIEIDFDAERMLVEQGMRLSSIPSAGQVVFLRSKANVSAGGTNIGLTELVHPDNGCMAIAAAAALSLDIAGVDLIITDIRRSYRETGGAICEVNNCPGIDFHALPTEGTSVNVASKIVDMLFPAGSEGRIPTLVICGHDRAARIARACAQLLRQGGYETGLATHSGIWIGGDRISNGDFANPSGAERVLWNQAVDAAVLQTSTSSILKQGLGYDRCDVVVLTELPDETTDGSQPLSALATAIKSSRTAVIFGADQSVPARLIHASQAQRLYANSPHIANKCAMAVELDGNTLKLTTPEKCDAFSLPATKWIAMPELAVAIAACHAMGLDPHLINDGLKTIYSKEFGNLLLSRLDSPIGSLLLATPRNANEVTKICSIARSWSAPKPPEVYVKMSYLGDAELLSALDEEINIGFARRFNSPQGMPLRKLSDLPFAAKDPSSKMLILTDNMGLFRKLFHAEAKAN